MIDHAVRRAIPITELLGVFEKGVVSHHSLDLRRRYEVIVHAVLFSWTRRASRMRYRERNIGESARKCARQTCLAGSGGRRNDEEIFFIHFETADKRG